MSPQQSILYLLLVTLMLPLFCNAKLKTTKSARYLWLTQTEKYLPPLFQYLRSRNDTDVIALAWKEPFESNDNEEYVILNKNLNKFKSLK
jgi:hypothetical protein